MLCSAGGNSYALGYCIANCTTGGSSWKIILYETVVLPLDIVIHLFTQGLRTCKVSTGVIELLHIYAAFPFNIEYLRDCAERSPLHSVTDLHLHGAYLTNNEDKNPYLTPSVSWLVIWICSICSLDQSGSSKPFLKRVVIIFCSENFLGNDLFYII